MLSGPLLNRTSADALVAGFVGIQLFCRDGLAGVICARIGWFFCGANMSAALWVRRRLKTLLVARPDRSYS